MIVVVDYGMGNLGSIVNMLKKVGSQAVVSSDPAVIERADKLILPGVGAFDHGRRNLEERGLDRVLDARVRGAGVPILGICLGMQLFTERSEEGSLPGLAWIEGETIRLRTDPSSVEMRVPHMGWNTVEPCRAHPLFAGLEGEVRFYFLHSYHVACRDDRWVVAKTHYGRDFVSAIAKANILGTQFHPEKSHRFGMQLVKNFVALP